MHAEGCGFDPRRGLSKVFNLKKIFIVFKEIPGNFGSTFYASQLSQQISLYKFARQIRPDALISVNTGQGVYTSVYHDHPDPANKYILYINEATSLEGFNGDTTSGPITTVTIYNDYGHELEIRVGDYYTGSPTPEISVDDFNTLTTNIITSDTSVTLQLLENSSGVKAWFINP